MGILRRVNLELLLVIIFISTICMVAPSYADDKDDAVNASADFVKALTDGDLESTYKGTSYRFQSAVSKQNFSESMGMMRIQLGGPLQKWSLQGAQELSRLPATGELGHFYFVRLIASYSTVNMYYDIGLDKKDGEWKVMWFNPLPAPPQS